MQVFLWMQYIGSQKRINDILATFEGAGLLAVFSKPRQIVHLYLKTFRFGRLPASLNVLGIRPWF